jgi:serine phosphatase RsbU (regulator of sigma subunit)/PAS domain-containing protein
LAAVVLGVAACTVLALVDALTGGAVVLIALLVIAPLGVATQAGPRATGLVGGYALLLSVLLGLQDEFGSSEHVVRLLVVTAGGALAIWISVLRERVERDRSSITFVDDAAAELDASLDFTTATDTLARLSVPRLADWAVVYVVLDDGLLGRFAIEHEGGSQSELARRVEQRFPMRLDQRGEIGEVVRSGEPELQDDALLLPLRARGRTFGALVLGAVRADARYGQQELAIARRLARRASLALNNARLYTELARAESDVRRSAAEVEAILGGVASGITVQDPTGNLTFANEIAARMLKVQSVEALLELPPGKIMERFEIFDEDMRPLSVSDLPGRIALRGEKPPDMVVFFKDRITGEERWSLVKATPIPGDNGSAALVVNIFDDITEQKRRELAERMLSEGSRLLTSSLDYAATLDNVAHLAVPGFADWCAVDVVDERGTIEQVALAHTDPSKIEAAEQMRERYRPDPNEPRGVPNVLRTGEPEVYAEVTDELLQESARDEQQLAMLRSIGLRSVIIAPMVARGRTFGTITFVNAESGRRFDDRDLELAEELARRAATAVENSRLYEERTHIAQTLQHSLLPPVLPDIPGVEVAARFRPAGAAFDVGGDFYDVFNTGAGWAVVIGDVCGKGPEAAALTGLARHTVRAAAMQEREPSKILEMLNDAIRHEHTNSQFCTAAYGHLELGTDGARLMLASGGHPLPLLVTADGQVRQVGVPGALLGTFEHVELHDEGLSLKPGAALVFFTDGVIEAGEPRGAFGVEGLEGLLATSAGLSANEIAERIDTAVVGLSEEPPDDVAVVVLRVRD